MDHDRPIDGDWVALLDRVSAENPDASDWLEVCNRVRQIGERALLSFKTIDDDVREDLVLDIVLKLVAKDSPAKRVFAAVNVPAIHTAYIGTMLRNAAITRNRKLKRERVVHRARALGVMGADAQGEDPFAAAANAETSIQIKTLLAKLTPDEQKLVKMRFWDRGTIQSIATALNLSYPAAAVRIFRLVRKLRDIFPDVAPLK